MEDAEPPEMCVLLRALLGSALLSCNSVIQIRQSHKQQLSFVPSPVRNGQQGSQAPHSTQDTSVPAPDPSPPLTRRHCLGWGWARGIKEQELPLALPANN